MALQIGDDRFNILILELKRELGEGDCDSTTQAGLRMKRSWIEPSVGYNLCLGHMSDSSVEKAIREKCCRPTFLSLEVARG